MLVGLRGRVLVFLSSFLAVDRENTADDALEAFLSGEVIDMQSRLNFMNLVKMSGAGASAKAEISEPDMQAFTRLYEQLGLPLPELNAAVDELRSTTELAANDPMPSRTALKPRKLAHLGWLQLPLIILLSSVVGAVIGIMLLSIQGKDKATPIPFGPYIAAAGWIALLWGEQITSAYLRYLGL